LICDDNFSDIQKAEADSNNELNDSFSNSEIQLEKPSFDEEFCKKSEESVVNLL